MKIHYKDEYEIELFIHSSDVVPRKKDAIILGDIDYFVKSVVYFPEEDFIEVILAEAIGREFKEDDNISGRLNEMQTAILANQRAYESLHKDHKSLRRQVSTVRTNAEQQAFKESKKTS
jgi:hypothetical protein